MSKNPVRNYAIEYVGGKNDKTAISSLIATAIEAAITAAADPTGDPLGDVVDEDGTAGISVGVLTPDGTPATVADSARYLTGMGLAWLDQVEPHVVGHRILVQWRDGADHLTDGKIVAKIGTVTSISPWTFSFGSQFDIVDDALDLRPQGDSLSVLDIGGGDYRAVVTFDYFDGTYNNDPTIAICDDPAETMTSASTWTLYPVALTLGSDQNFIPGRVHLLQNGEYAVGAGYISGSTTTIAILKVPDITDWSAPTVVTIVSGTDAWAEPDIEEMPDGELLVQLRNDTDFEIYGSASSDHGDTWDVPTSLFPGTGYPAWRRLWSGIRLTAYRSPFDPTADTAWRQSPSIDTDYGAATILDATGTANEGSSLLQLDANHVLVVYAVEYAPGGTNADIFLQVFTDSTVFATSGTVRVSPADVEPGTLIDKLVAGQGIRLTKLAPGGDEQLEIAATELGGVTVQEEGVDLATRGQVLNFVGSGVTATGTGATKTITITSAGTSPSDTSIWRPVMDGAGAVITDGATGEAIMAYGPA